jgi:hypothetical protein
MLIDELRHINESMSKSLACYRHILLAELKGETVLTDFEAGETEMIQIEAHPLVKIKELKIPFEKKEDKGDESKSYA